MEQLPNAEAKPRKLKAVWTVIPRELFKAVYGLDWCSLGCYTCKEEADRVAYEAYRQSVHNDS